MEVDQDLADQFDDVYFSVDLFDTIGPALQIAAEGNAAAMATELLGYPIYLGDPQTTRYDDPGLQATVFVPGSNLTTTFPERGLIRLSQGYPYNFDFTYYFFTQPDNNYYFESGFTYPNVAMRISSAIPETNTWVMMVVGFFGLGAVLRAGRRNQFGAHSEAGLN
jgi:hypothetical protein